MVAVAKKTVATQKIGQSSVITAIETDNDDLRRFLFTLGCYEGEVITILSTVSDTFVVALKDARYSIDKDFAQAIVVE